MAHASMTTSKDLLSVSTECKVSESLIVNKKVQKLEDLRKNFKPAPSSVLSQVRDFLPRLAAANKDLQKRIEEDPSCCLDIEQLEDDSSPHIEMNLALVEQDSSYSSDSDSDDDDDCDVNYGAVTSANIVLPGHKKDGKQAGKQLIQEVNNGSVSDNTCNSESTVNSELSSKQSMDTDT